MAKAITPRQRKENKAVVAKSSAIVVLGMHRSGTSALSGVLSQFGCEAPKTQMPLTPHNEKGYFESVPLSELLDRILKSQESSWRDWRQFNPKWLESEESSPVINEVADLIDAEFPKSKVILLKNPRLCRLVPLCTEALKRRDVKPYFVLTHRNPIEVEASLKTRDDVPAALAHLLWLRHVLDAEFETRNSARYFTSYTAVLADWETEITQMQKVSGITFAKKIDDVRKEIGAFLSPKLRHHQVPTKVLFGDLDVSEWTRKVFEILERWVGTSGHPQDYKTLDDIRHQFNGMAQNYYNLVQGGVVLPEIKANYAKALATTQTDLKAAQGELATVKGLLHKQASETEAEKALAETKFQEVAKQLSDTTQQMENTQLSLKQRCIEIAQAYAISAEMRANFEAAADVATSQIKALQDERQKHLHLHHVRETEWQQDRQDQDEKLSNLVAQLDADHAAHQSAAISHIAERAAAQQEIAQLQDVVNQHTTRISDLSKELQTTLSSLEKMTASASWRLTKPLRWFDDKMGKLFGRKQG